MKTTRLFVAALVVGCAYAGPRLLASGQPACGNVVAKGNPQPKPNPKPSPQPPPPPPSPKPESSVG